MRIDTHLKPTQQQDAPITDELIIEETKEEIKEPESPIIEKNNPIEETKEIQPIKIEKDAPIVVRQVVMAESTPLKLKLPGLNSLAKGFIKNIIEE